MFSSLNHFPKNKECLKDTLKWVTYLTTAHSIVAQLTAKRTSKTELS